MITVHDVLDCHAPKRLSTYGFVTLRLHTRRFKTPILWQPKFSCFELLVDSQLACQPRGIREAKCHVQHIILTIIRVGELPENVLVLDYDVAS